MTASNLHPTEDDDPCPSPEMLADWTRSHAHQVALVRDVGLAAVHMAMVPS